MAINRGKQFEDVIRECMKRIPETTIIRMPDPTNGYLGIRNISDFIAYHYPHQYFLECKSVHGNTLPLSNITLHQWDGLIDVAQINGVVAGVICWWVDKDTTRFIPIEVLREIGKTEKRSIRFDHADNRIIDIPGEKKRVFFDYDLSVLFKEDM